MSAESTRTDREIPLRDLGLAAGSLVLFHAALRLAVAGLLGVGLAAVVVTGSFLGIVAALRRLRVLDRHGVWVVGGAAFLYLPLLGSFSLVDPWETHYAEVAREMVARRDFISPWWAQEPTRWFWSKPVLDLWLEATSMRALGVHTEPGAMLAPVAGVFPRPEWAIRLPAFLFAVAGLAFLHRGAARAFGRRAALFAVLVLGTMPQFFLMARQATTDMPLVGSLSAVLGLILTAASAEPGEQAPSVVLRLGGRAVRIHAVHAVLAGAVLAVAPQVLYLVSQNLTLGPGLAIHFVTDHFWSGSAGNADVPGNAAAALQAPVFPEVPPALQAMAWAAALGFVVVSHARERRLDRVSYLGAFLFAAIATMAKGPVGIVLPAAVLFMALVVTGRLRVLTRIPLAGGVVLVLAATLPWYVASFVRHGAPFTDELVFRHMIGRATSHLHDTNAGDDVSFRFYVWQLGYAVYGWAGLLPAALAFWPAVRPGEGGRAANRLRFGQVTALLWVALTFALFTAMPTKFHHYIFPALPPAALLIGILLDDLAGPSVRLGRGAIGTAALGGAALVLLVARDLASPGVAGEARLLNLVTYNYQRPWPDAYSARGAIAAAGIAFAVFMAALAVPRARRWAVLGLPGVAVVVALWGLDGYVIRVAPHWGQRELIVAYLRARSSEADPIGAFNMNWKGENFYTGNRVAVFPAGGKITTWIEARRKAGARAVFFLTEHGRVPALRKEMGEPKGLELLTTPADNNKFVLVRVTYE